MDDTRCAPGSEVATEPPDSQQIILELESSLETFLVATGCLSLLAAVGGTLSALDAKSSFTLRDARWFLLGALLVGLGSFALRALIEEYYILDLEQRQLFFHRRWWRWRWLVPVAPFSHFVAFAVNGKYESSKSGSWWEYAPVLVTRDKRIYSLADAFRDEAGYSLACDKAREMATLSGAPLHPPEPQRMLKAVAPGPTLYYVERPSNWPWILATILAGLAVACAAGLFLGN